MRPARTPPRRSTPFFASAIFLAALHGIAHAQSTEYRLDENGNWVQTAVAEEGTDAALMSRARRAIAEERPSEARSALDDWLTANERTKNPYLAEGYLLRGDALTALGKDADALYDYEKVAIGFVGTEQFVTAVERELDIGVRYLNGLKRRFLGMRILPNEDTGQELLIRVQERMPGSRLAERAGIELADYYYNTRQLELAALAYELFIDNYPNSQYAMKARQRRIYSVVGRYKGPRYDGSSLTDSKILTKRFANLYPVEAQQAGLDEGLVVRIDESAAQEMLESAEWYQRRSDDISARFVYRRLLREHPRTAAAARALAALEAKGWPVEDPAIVARRERIAKAEAEERASKIKVKEAPSAGAAKPADAKQPEPKPSDAKPSEPKPASSGSGSTP